MSDIKKQWLKNAFCLVTNIFSVGVEVLCNLYAVQDTRASASWQMMNFIYFLSDLWILGQMNMLRINSYRGCETISCFVYDPKTQTGLACGQCICHDTMVHVMLYWLLPAFRLTCSSELSKSYSHMCLWNDAISSVANTAKSIFTALCLVDISPQ